MSSAQPSLASSQPCKVLVVEDDPDIGQLHTDLLSIAGYTVLLAVSGRDAFDLVERVPVHIILLDVRLPDIDGFTVCRGIRTRISGDLPILMMSANCDVNCRAKARAVGANDFLAKPFRNVDLLQSIQRLLKN